MSYVPERGDLIWLGTRPALVLSPKDYNAKVGLAVVCPVTSRVKGYPFEVALPAGDIHGVVLADHVRSVDWRARDAKKGGRAPAAAVRETLGKLGALLA